MINSSASGILSLFKWLIFQQLIGFIHAFFVFRVCGPEGRTDWRLAHPAVRLPASRSRRASNFEGSRPRRLDIHSEISLATEYRLSYPGPFVKRKMRAVPHGAVPRHHRGSSFGASCRLTALASFRQGDYTSSGPGLRSQFASEAGLGGADIPFQNMFQSFVAGSCSCAEGRLLLESATQ